MKNMFCKDVITEILMYLPLYGLLKYRLVDKTFDKASIFCVTQKIDTDSRHKNLKDTVEILRPYFDYKNDPIDLLRHINFYSRVRVTDPSIVNIKGISINKKLHVASDIATPLKHTYKYYDREPVSETIIESDDGYVIYDDDTGNGYAFCDNIFDKYVPVSYDEDDDILRERPRGCEHKKYSEKCWAYRANDEHAYDDYFGFHNKNDIRILVDDSMCIYVKNFCFKIRKCEDFNLRKI